MKKTPPSVVVPPSRRFWPAVALSSLVVNLGLAGWVWRATQAGPAVLPAPAATVAVTPPAPVQVRTRELQSYAALGSFMAENNRIAELQWTGPQFAAFLEGFRATYEKHSVPLDDDAKALQATISQRVQAMMDAERPSPVEEYFKTLREKEGVSRTPSGLHYRITEPGFGPTPQGDDTVVISFAARLPDGQALPALSRTRTRSAVRDLLPGLAEGVQLLRVGGKALVYVPPALAFSEESWPAELPRHAPVAFFLELHEIAPAAK